MFKTIIIVIFRGRYYSINILKDSRKYRLDMVQAIFALRKLLYNDFFYFFSLFFMLIIFLIIEIQITII